MATVRVYNGEVAQERWLDHYHGGGNAVTTNAAFTVGRVMVLELTVLAQIKVDAIAYIVGATSSGDVTVGIYGPVSTRETPDGTALIVESSTTAQGSTNTPQIVTFTATVLQPGTYYIVLEGSSATGTYLRHNNQEQILGYVMRYDRGGGYGALTNPCPATVTLGNAPALRLRVLSS